MKETPREVTGVIEEKSSEDRVALSEYERKLQIELQKIEREEEENRHVNADIENTPVATVPANMPNLQKKNDQLRKNSSLCNTSMATKAIQQEQSAIKDKSNASQFLSHEHINFELNAVEVNVKRQPLDKMIIDDTSKMKAPPPVNHKKQMP